MLSLLRSVWHSALGKSKEWQTYKQTNKQIIVYKQSIYFNARSLSLKLYLHNKMFVWCYWMKQTKRYFFCLLHEANSLPFPNFLCSFSTKAELSKLTGDIIKKTYMLVILRWAHSWIFMSLLLSSDSLCVSFDKERGRGMKFVIYS